MPAETPTCPLFSAQAHAPSRQCLSKALADPRAVSPQRSQRAGGLRFASGVRRPVRAVELLAVAARRQNGTVAFVTRNARLAGAVQPQAGLLTPASPSPSSPPCRLGAAEADGT